MWLSSLKSVSLNKIKVKVFGRLKQVVCLKGETANSGLAVLSVLLTIHLIHQKRVVE